MNYYGFLSTGSAIQSSQVLHTFCFPNMKFVFTAWKCAKIESKTYGSNHGSKIAVVIKMNRKCVDECICKAYIQPRFALMLLFPSI